MKIIEPKQSLIAKEVTAKRYLMTDLNGQPIETVGEMLWRVATHMAKPEVLWDGNGVMKETAEKFYERMVALKFVCSGKAMFEAGNPGGIGQLAACFVLPITDSIAAIFKTLGQAAVVHKNNGGTGFNFSKIRPHGDKVKNVPHAASGPVDFIKVFSAALGKILQGAKRQGGNIAVLNADHPDIEEFITMKSEDGTIKNFNVSVGVTDKFMTAVVNKKPWQLINPRTHEVVKTIRADKIFDMICQSAWATGDPGMAFLDAMEADNPTPSLGKLEATNPCITGDALIATEYGLMEFKQVYERFHNPGRVGLLVDRRAVGGQGTELKPSHRVLSQGTKIVYRLETKSGFSLKATGDHKIMSDEGWKELSRLRPGDKVLIQPAAGSFGQDNNLSIEWNNQPVGKNGRHYSFNLPVKWSRELGVLLGWLVGDGFVRKDYAILSFGSKDKKEQQYFVNLFRRWACQPLIKQPTPRTTQVVCHSRFVADYLMRLGILAVKSARKRVPKTIFTAPKEAVVGFLQGLFGADGTVGFVKDKSSYIRLTSKSKGLLGDVQLLLLNLGIKARIYNRSRPPRQNLFPAYKSASGRVKQYGSDGKLWELEVSKDSVGKFLKEIGWLFGKNREKIVKLKNKTYYATRFTDEVLAVTKLAKEAVYDVTEPETHSFIANGFVVHNCGEIPLLPYESCNLGSINLVEHVKGKDVDWDELKKTVHLGIRFLDNMVEVNNYPLEEIQRMVKDGNRRIGLGVMGFGHLLYRLKIPYNSTAAVKLSEKLSRFIRAEADKTSQLLGKKRGNFGHYDVSIYADKGLPRRNCATTMIAPTGTISLFADCSSGVEPVFSLVTLRNTFFEDDSANRPTKSLKIVDQEFEHYLDKHFNPKQKQQILEQAAVDGSVKNIKAIPVSMRKVLVTTHEIEPEYHVRTQAAWQKHFDNSVSKTINFGHQATQSDIKKAYLAAWKLRCKGITIYRDGSKADQVLNLSGTEPADAKTMVGGPVCPDCAGKLINKEGCATCIDCGWSKCTI